MEPTVNTKNVHHVFGEFDRVSIDVKPFHISMKTQVGHLMTAVDGPEISQQFSHEELAQLGGNGRMRVERDFFHADAAQKRLLRPQVSVSAMTGRPLRRLTKKDAYCAAALELHAEKLMNFTDCSMKANMQLLVGRVMHLAGNHLPDGAMEVKASENLATPPSLRTLRRWLAERDDLGLVGHLDAMSRRGNRGSRHCPEVVAIMMKEVRGYLYADKPTIKMIYERVHLAVLERNEERAELGLYPFAIPSRETVRRAVRALDPFPVELARNGLAAARKKFRPVSNGICVTRPLERVEIDEWTVDVQALMKSSGIYDAMTDEERHSLGLYFEDEVDEKTCRKTMRPVSANNPEHEIGA